MRGRKTTAPKPLFPMSMASAASAEAAALASTSAAAATPLPSTNGSSGNRTPARTPSRKFADEQAVPTRTTVDDEGGALPAIKEGTLLMARIAGEGGRFRQARVLKGTHAGDKRVLVRFVQTPHLELTVDIEKDIVSSTLRLGMLAVLSVGQRVFCRTAEGFFVPGKVQAQVNPSLYRIVFDNDELLPPVKRADIVLDGEIATSHWRLQPGQVVGANWSPPAPPLIPVSINSMATDATVGVTRQLFTSPVNEPWQVLRSSSLSSDDEGPAYHPAIIDQIPLQDVYLVSFLGIIEQRRLLSVSSLTLSRRYWQT